MKTKSVFDCTKLSYREMANIIQAIRTEVKRRNPIGVNIHNGTIAAAEAELREISAGEIDNYTSECGPREKAPIKNKKR